MLNRFFKVLFFLLIVCQNFVLFSYAGTWVEENGKYKYDDDGVFIYGEQKAIDKKWYMFDEDGYMVTGFYEFDDKFYYFNEDGTPATGPIEYNGRKYNITNKGEIKNITESDFLGYQDYLQRLYKNNTSEEGKDIVKECTDLSKTYIDTYPISRRALKRILKEKGYKGDVIQHVITSSNIDWKKQAEKCAKYYYDKSQFKREEMISILKSEEFTDVEAKYGTEMSFVNDTLSSGIGKTPISTLQVNYLDDISLPIIGKKISDIDKERIKKESESRAKESESRAKEYESRAKIESESRAKVKEQESIIAAELEKNTYKIESKINKTQQFSLIDDDAENGKIRVKFTIPFPKIKGPKADEVNALLERDLFKEVKDIATYYNYDHLYNAKVYKATSVSISSQNENSLTLKFDGPYTVEVVIDLTTMTFKNEIVKK